MSEYEISDINNTIIKIPHKASEKAGLEQEVDYQKFIDICAEIMAKYANDFDVA